jgi:hypothetical protein
MGQAFYIVNKTRNEYIHPHDCGDGYKLLELETSVRMLAILLSNDDDHPWSGAPGHGEWSGDSIAVVGEYSDMGADIDKMIRRNMTSMKNWMERHG